MALVKLLRLNDYITITSIARGVLVWAQLGVAIMFHTY